MSRFDRKTGREYLVVANNATTSASATFTTWNRNEQFSPLYGTTAKLRSGRDRSVRVTLPPLTVSVWRSSTTADGNVPAPTVSLSVPQSGVFGRAEISADVSTQTFAQATFLVRPVGASTWTTIGTDDNAPFRVFHDVSAYPIGTMLEYRVVVKDSVCRYAADGAWTSGDTAVLPPPPAENGDPVAQPGAVSVPGTHNSEMGCAADWEPACAGAQLTLDPNDQIWKGTFTIPAGTYGYKYAIDNSWTENYGAKGIRDGANIDYETPDGTVSYYYDHATHWGTSDEEGPIITTPGDFQSELGCSADWDPACMRMWLQDKDGDGVFTIATTKIPAGTWSFKVAHNLSWTENYGAGGVLDGGNVTVTVPAAGATTVFSYDVATHIVSASSS